MSDTPEERDAALDDFRTELEIARGEAKRLRLDLAAERDLRLVMQAMLVRAIRGNPEPTDRANLFEDLAALVPGALDELRAEERPEALRRRSALAEPSPSAAPDASPSSTSDASPSPASATAARIEALTRRFHELIHKPSAHVAQVVARILVEELDALEKRLAGPR